MWFFFFSLQQIVDSCGKSTLYNVVANDGYDNPIQLLVLNESSYYDMGYCGSKLWAEIGQNGLNIFLSTSNISYRIVF